MSQKRKTCVGLAALLGAGLCGAIAAAFPQPQPAPVFQQARPQAPAGKQASRSIDFGLVIECALCGFVLGAGAGAIMDRRRDQANS